MFDKALSEAKLSTWQLLKSIMTNFLGSLQIAEYKKEIEELLKSFSQFGVRMSIKEYFHTWTIFQTTVEIGMKKTLASWKSATKVGGM